METSLLRGAVQARETVTRACSRGVVVGYADALGLLAFLGRMSHSLFLKSMQCISDVFPVHLGPVRLLQTSTKWEHIAVVPCP